MTLLRPAEELGLRFDLTAAPFALPPRDPEEDEDQGDHDEEDEDDEEVPPMVREPEPGED
jgi:hypothetical protein